MFDNWCGYSYSVSWFLIIDLQLFSWICTEDPKPIEEKRPATWGTDVPEDVVLDEKLLADALKKVI